jgi:alpha-glucosidase (family GH31 glycosyl hydrolase)
VANSVLVAPVLEYLDKETTYDAYFPQGKWVNLANYSEVIDATAGGKSFTLNDKPVVNAFLKQGALIPFQEDPDQTVMTTADLLAHPITIIANRDSNGFSTGKVFLDQGISNAELSDNKYEYYQINHQSQSLQFTLSAGSFGAQNHVFNKAIIVDAKDLSGANFACAYDTSFNKINFFPYYDEKMQALELRSDQETPLKFSDIKVIYYGSTEK